MLDQFVLRKNTMIQVLDQAVAFARQKENSLAASLLVESRERLIQETFTLVILGEFKRGKSTFINALLGAQLLPTAIVPLTAIPTVIRYGESLVVHAVHMNGVIEEITLEQI
ncbi:Bacterial dynamin-like protein [Pelotomaculum sp. FP]|uniref:dynamin family protein n=1 Tax=Pelotomaculum sp. FP TaxID=261474 RepID=UPI001104CEE3|nr:dynamin family protein [Pelotomaculum sp. FP]TEB17527.1 Bacterial dynamin-like protein [Pelotomaculum sp. FP]